VTEITAHVLDTTTGRPAGGVAVGLYRRENDGTWTEVGHAITRSDGRTVGLSGEGARPGVHGLTFDTAAYHEQWAAFFDDVTVSFRVEPGDGSLALRLAISPFGYSVFKGE
jgi:5-hydroxyisourate hydrolase